MYYVFFSEQPCIMFIQQERNLNVDDKGNTKSVKNLGDKRQTHN